MTVDFAEDNDFHGAKPRLYLFHMARKKKLDNDLIIPKDDESISFVQGLVARGQAATPRKDGSLPPGATHEIVGMTKTGLPILRRRRFAGNA